MTGFQRPGNGGKGFWIATLVLVLPAVTPVEASVSDSGDRQRLQLQVDGLSASIGEDNPRVLYILPWQAPTLPRRPRASLPAEFPELRRPVDPTALEHHRVFRNTLNPLILSPVDGSD